MFEAEIVTKCKNKRFKEEICQKLNIFSFIYLQIKKNAISLHRFLKAEDESVTFKQIIEDK